MKTFNDGKWDADADNNMYQELFKKKKKSKSKLIEKAKNKLKQTTNIKVIKNISKLTNKLNLQSDDTINLIKSPVNKIKKKKKQKNQTTNGIEASHLLDGLNRGNKHIKKQKKNNSLDAPVSSIKKVKNQKKKLQTKINKLANSNVETEELANLLKTPTASKNVEKSQITTDNELSQSTSAAKKEKTSKPEKKQFHKLEKEISVDEIITKSKKRRMRRLKRLKDTDKLAQQINNSSNHSDSKLTKKNKKSKLLVKLNSNTQEITNSKRFTKEIYPDNVQKTKKRNKLKVFEDNNNEIVETIPESINKLKNEFEKQIIEINKNVQSQKKTLTATETKSSYNTNKKKEKFFGKLKDVLKEVNETKPKLSLRQRMMEKLKAARFRFINEQIYTTDSKEAQKLFQTDPEAFKAYHDGYRKQVKRWPLNPLDAIIKSIKRMPNTHVVADFGCGDAILSKSVDQKVHSFDLVAVDDTVIECDMCKVPLENDSVDVAVFCLSLMGTNLRDYLLEANRVLKVGGILKIAEVESRFENIDDFIKGVSHFGFKNSVKDLSNNLFYFLDFKKERPIIKHKKKLPTIGLNPCLYKKR